MLQRAYIEITNHCNLRCAFCPGTRRKAGQMSCAGFSRALTQLRPQTSYLYFHVLGEPLLHPELGDFLRMAGESGFRVCLTTNGTELERRRETLLGSPGLHKISVSLHSFEGNEGAGSMADYLSSLWRVCRELAEAGILCVLRLWNEGGLESRNGEILHFLETATGLSQQDWPIPRPGTQRLGAHLFLERAERFDWPSDTAPEQGTEFCHGLRKQIAVLCDGTVVPCCLDGEGGMALGNLFAQDLEEILQSPRALAIYDGFSRRQPTENLCRRCGYATRFNERKQ